MSKLNALVVDDTPANRDFLVRLMIQAQFEVFGAGSGQEALAHVQQGIPFSLALIDMQLPDMTGLKLTESLRQQYPDIVIVVATMYDDHSWINNSFLAGANVFLVKPHGFMELFKRLTSGGLDAMRTTGPQVIDQYGPRPFRVVANK